MNRYFMSRYFACVSFFHFLITRYMCMEILVCRRYIESRTGAHKFAFILMQDARQEVSMEPVLLHEWLNIAPERTRFATLSISSTTIIFSTPASWGKLKIDTAVCSLSRKGLDRFISRLATVWIRDRSGPRLGVWNAYFVSRVGSFARCELFVECERNAFNCSRMTPPTVLLESCCKEEFHSAALKPFRSLLHAMCT